MALADLVRMLNQISANFAYEDSARAAVDVATHVRSFWTPAMRDEIVEHLHAGGSDLSEISRLALAQLEQMV